MRKVAVVAIKSIHTVIFFALGGALVYFFWSGVRGRSDRRAVIAGVALTAEVAIFAGNGWRCPLTSVAEDLGAESGSVSDIYLPRWLRENLPFVTGPIFAIAALLHARNLRTSRRVTDPLIAYR